jgi:amino acid transporter
VIGFWAFGYLWKGEGWLQTSQIDIDTGRREVDWDTFNAEKQRIAQKGPFGRFMHAMF